MSNDMCSDGDFLRLAKEGTVDMASRDKKVLECRHRISSGSCISFRVRDISIFVQINPIPIQSSPIAWVQDFIKYIMYVLLLLFMCLYFIHILYFILLCLLYILSSV